MQVDITPIFLEFIPSELEEGKLYISKEYEIAVHLCMCGCKGKTVTPLGQGEWTLTESENGNVVSLQPSIGNWSGEKPTYHAHYFITNNKAIFV